MKKCFVVSPIGGEETDIRKRADKVYNHIIMPVCKECGFEPIRSDLINQSDSITQTIIDSLINSELVIADMTGHNPNVFYEMGFRSCTKKPMIHLREKNENIPSDIAGIRAFDYDLTDLDAVAEIKRRLSETIRAFNIEENKNEENNSGDGVTAQSNTTHDSPVLPILYSIQDEISKLRADIQNKDTETIQTIVRAAQPTAPIENPETALLKILLPELIKNPNAIKTLIEIGEMTQQGK